MSKRKIKARHIGKSDGETARNAGVSRSAVSQSRVKSKAGLETMEQVLLRKETALANLREAEAALAMGRAVSVADFEATMAGMIGAARGKLLPLGALLGPQVAMSDDPNECQSLIDAAVHEALLELSHGPPTDDG